MIGINIRNDGAIDYAALICDGVKRYETRNTNSLKAYIGKRVGIVRTGTKEKAQCIGSAVLGAPIVVNAEQFRMLEHAHLVKPGSTFDIDRDGVKYLYPIIKPQKFAVHLPVKHGIVSRTVILPERNRDND